MGSCLKPKLMDTRGDLEVWDSAGGSILERF